MQERRTAPRFHANLNVRWESLRTQGYGSVCDLSTTGCFVLTGGEVVPRDLIRLELLPTDKPATLWGQVVYQINEMGFAVRFVFGTEKDRQPLTTIIATLNGR